MATYRQQFKGSGTGKSDYTIRVYLTGAAWYLSSAMLIIEEQNGKDSDLYRAAKAEHAQSNVLPELYLEMLRSSVSTMMFIYIHMYCVPPWRRN